VPAFHHAVAQNFIVAEIPLKVRNLSRTRSWHDTGQCPSLRVPRAVVRASYAFPAPLEILRCGPVFESGIGDLDFAGEHTCYAFVGYMEGALQSGIRACNRVMVKDGLAKQRFGIGPIEFCSVRSEAVKPLNCYSY
jgi:hypothetical protein